MIAGNVFEIQGFSVHDGPGIRTTFFLKGCPLRCQWCHNPEGMIQQPQLQYMDEKCIQCQRCVGACPAGCHVVSGGTHTVDFKRCKGCFRCVAQCPSRALNQFGREMTAQEVLHYAKKDASFFGKTGGVTFSGGEATMQPEFLLDALKVCKNGGFSTAVDTSGYCDFAVLEQMLPYVDLFLYDIKAYTEQLHKIGTGVSNKRILENFIGLQKQGARIWVRIPLIPGFNATEQELTKIAEFLSQYRQFEQIELMPYHLLGRNKYAQIGLIYPYEGKPVLRKEEINRYAAIFQKYKLPLEGSSSCLKEEEGCI